MKRVVVAVCLYFLCANALAQDWAKIPENKSAASARLKVGDRISFAELHNVINYPKKTYKFSDHKPKLTILDFWDTQCSPCIKAWPATLKLQEEFGADLQIILVNKQEDQKRVKSFLAKRKTIDGIDMNLPMSCRDSTIWKGFPISSLPQYVWIGSDDVIGSIGYGKDMTSENIRKWITSGPFKMEQLSDKQYYSVVPWEPIFVNGNGGEKPNDVFIWTSSVTKGQDDNPTNASIFYDVKGYGITITNSSILHLYGYAYNNRLREHDIFDYLPTGRIELIAKDTTKYHGDGTLGGNTYNYQLISGKLESRDQLLNMMHQDLQRYFGLDVKWEKRTRKCFVITMFDSTLVAKRKSLGSQGQLMGGKITIDSISVKDLTMLMEVSTWYYRSRKYPIVDETGYKGMILGVREQGKVDLVNFNRILEKVGLSIKLEMREVDILVLREPEERMH